MQNTLEITGHSLTLQQVRQVAENPRIGVCLSDASRTAVTASRKVIEGILASGKTVYGVNTGFGSLSHVTIPQDQIDQLQLNLIRSHACGTGEPIDSATVRAMMLLRANTLAKGYSGVRPEVIEKLLALLNAEIYPVIPSQGS
ncbi:MAG: aromatic amino acid lyase, partial [Vampirovibrio sp.]|nr:aromatic amino acid lyase [Vampirovibrio sp.]